MLDFYYVEKSYVDFLRQFDPQVPSLEYVTHDKFFCGVVFNINNIKYYAPISHDTKKQQTNIIIENKGQKISSIKFSFMIPVPNDVLTKIDFNEIAKTDIKYANLLRAEYKYCSSHVNDIQAKANAVYKIGLNTKHQLHHVCCKFKDLESIMTKYIL